MDAAEVIRRYNEQYQQRRSNFDQDADLIERFISPIRGGKFYQEQDTEAEIQFRRPEVFDSTAMNAANLLSASVQGAITPADTKWFNLLFRDDLLNEDQASKEWLEECGERLFLALQDSSFELTNQEVTEDMVDFGNGFDFEEAELDDGVYTGLSFSAIPIREAYFEEDHRGNVLNFYRRLQWTPLQIKDKFPDDQIPDSVRAKLDNPSSAQVRQDVIFCIYKRHDKRHATYPASPENRPYGALYVIHDDAQQIGEDLGYYEMPIDHVRWSKTSGSKWGHGPGHLALPTVLTLQNMVKQELAYIEKVIDPPSLVSERNAFGSLDLTAGGVTVVADIDGIRPYEANARYGEAKMTMAEQREQVQSIFKIDQLQLKQSPAMTATEAQIRYDEILRMLGPTRGRIETEYLSKVLQRTFNIMYRYEQFDEVPEAVIEYTRRGGELDIKYLGPMARAQKMDAVASIERWTAGVAGMAQTFPDMIDKVDSDAVVVELAELGGVPAKLMRDPNEVKKIRAAREAQQQAMAEATMAQEQGAGAQAMAEGEAALQAVS